ncbi:endonuclease MutS2 [Selenomonas bovis]|uniref:Endonuclease MutS2 n=1 Tax=Selenomonas bovis TaxID=416586 RepID=A0A848B2P6_9FIRM|nr:endonuclease MutS2 [Selenomonas bovis]NMD98163.1 endonuclease MutS2 [Selenomonas bovis]
MEKESYKVLEYEKIREMLAARAGSSLGKERARSLQPSTDYAEVEEQLEQTAEAVRIHAVTSPPFGGIHDLRPLLKKIHMGAVLTLEELVDIRSTLYAMRSVKEFFKGLEIEAPTLKEWAHGIEILGQLERRLENTLDEHGSLRDDASVELRRLRTEIQTTQNRIKERVGAALRAPENQKYFQEAIVTLRDERYVIPVKAEYRRFFPGIVHDQSATGATLFVEPMAIVELNNDVKQLVLSEQHEVERILRDLSQQIGGQQDILQENLSVLADFDFTFAKAKLAEDMDAQQPVMNREGRMHLRQARHPLIPRDRVVPIDIELGDAYTMLLITGPNTGGKTVSMKTFGLLVLMAQSGCFLPTAPDSTLPVYQNIYADIGDEQSIEQSLSTFSAHMTHIVDILSKVEADDLVLVDELGAGTDPEEGAALAMAILERLLAVKAATVATTHYSELKTFAYTREGIENACVEFDVKSLRPTYRLLIGIPGASNAFAISRRLGLSEAIILRAQQLVKEDHAQFEHVVNELEREKLVYEQHNAELAERQQRVTRLEQKVEAAKEDLSKRKGELIRKAREQSAALVRRTRREAEDIIDSLKKQYDDQGIHARQQAIQEARKRLEEASSAARPGIMGQKHLGQKVDAKKLMVGDVVYLPKLDQKGTVVEISGRDVTVQLGSLRTTQKAASCRFLSHAEKEKSAKSNATGGFLRKTAHVSREIDIRGLMVNEAEVVVGKFIDDAQMAGLTQILVIHGKGTGALRKGIHEYLKRHRSVDHFAFADLDEGGSGATVVFLK